MEKPFLLEPSAGSKKVQKGQDIPGDCFAMES